MNVTLKKFIVALILIVTINNFLMQPVAMAAYDTSAFGEVIDFLLDVLGGLIGLLTWPERLLAIEVAERINWMTTVIVNVDNGSNPVKAVTPFDILFNKVKILDINFFDIKDSMTSGQEGEIVNRIRLGVAGWFYAMRNVAAAILLCILLYVGIRMAISTIASDRAMYKKMLVDWVCSLVLIFVLQYIMIATIFVNNAIVNALSAVGDSELITETYKTIGDIAKKAFDINSFAAVIVFCMLVWQTIGLFVAYFNRLIKIAFLIIISPLISITYSIDKMGDGKAQALNNWLKEFIFTVLIQPFHCAIYMCMTGTALDILVTKSGGGVSDDTLAASIVAILCIKFIKDAEKLVKKIFAFKSDDSKTSMAAGLAVSAMALSNAKGLGASGRRFIGGAVNLAKNTGKIARDVAVDTMAMGALLASKDKDKTFAETKEEMGAKWDNWRADRIEKKNQKYTTNRSLRAAAAMKKANKNLKYLGKDGAMAKADAAFEKEKEAKVEARTKEKIAQSGGTMSEDAARAAARKEIAKETRTANSPVRRSIKKASGWVDTAKKNIASSAVLRELGGIAKSKVATSFGIVAGAGLYGSNGNLATAITTGAAVGTSMNEFMKSTKGTVVNQSSSLVKDFNGTNANPNELRKDLNKIFETESEKYDGSSDTLKEMDRLLSDLDNLIGSSAADGYRTDMKNVIENNAELANDGVDAIFDRIEKNNPDIANNESYKKMKKDTLHHADGVALYANMKKVGETGISTQDYTEMLVTEVFPDDADRATYASTRDVNTTEQDKHIQILDGEQDAIDNEVSTMGDAELERFCESVDNEFETQMLVMESLDNSDPVRENYKNYIKEMKKKRDDAIIALYAKGNRDLETVSEQFAERAKEIIAQRHEELLKEAQDNNPTIRQNAQVRLEKSNKAMTNLNISLNNNTNTEAES